MCTHAFSSNKMPERVNLSLKARRLVFRSKILKTTKKVNQNRQRKSTPAYIRRIVPLPCTDTLPEVKELASYRNSESCAGKVPIKPERSRMSRQTKIRTTFLQSWGVLRMTNGPIMPKISI